MLGEFKLDEGAGTQLISGKVHHNQQAFNGKEYAQLLTDLYAVASEANSCKIMQVISMIILLMYAHTYIGFVCGFIDADRGKGTS